MADISLTGASIIASSSGNQVATVTAHGIAGVAITAGQVLYADPSANNQLKPALAAGTAIFQAANVVGVALNTASANQAVNYAVAGDIQITGTPLTSGLAYVVSTATAGSVVAVNDTTVLTGTGNFACMVGIGNGIALGSTTGVLRLTIIPSIARL